MKKLELLATISFIVTISSCMSPQITTLVNNNLDNAYTKRKMIYQENKKKKIIDLLKNKKNSDDNTEIYINTSLNSKNFSIKSSSNSYIRKKIFQLGSHPINESHKNDKQLYSPFDINSLSNFTLYDGDLLANSTKLSSMTVNGSDNVNFEPSIVLLELEDASKLDLFKKLYNAQVLDELDGYYKIQVDLDKAPLDKLDILLQEYNKISPININSIEFSSVASLKTFVIMLDFLVNNKQSIKNILVDAISNDLPFEPTDLKAGYTTCLETSKRTDWHFKDTDLIQAWDMSIGSKINIAWLETSGFKPKHPEISRRILDYGNNNATLGSLTEFGTDIVYSEGYVFSSLMALSEAQLYHGHYALMTCCAEKNNKLKTVGSAPNVNVAPYSFQGIYSMATAINRARSKKVDIIGINQSQRNYVWSAISWGTPASDGLFKVVNFFTGVGPAETEIYRARNIDNIPVVVAAHNYGENIYGNNFGGKDLTEIFPASSPDVITVGGVETSERGCEYNNSNSLNAYKVFWYPDSKGLFGTSFFINGKGSDYGKDNMVWAPSYYMLTSRFETDTNVLKNKYPVFYEQNQKLHGSITNNTVLNEVQKIFEFSGTSAATPFTTGIIALMKSRNPNLTPSEIEDILYNTTFPRTAVTHDNMQKDGFKTPVKIIDAKMAVEEAIKRKKNGSTTPSDYIAQTSFGIFKLDNNALSSNSTNNKPIGTLTSNDGTFTNVLRSASDDELLNANGKAVELLGWNTLKTGLSTEKAQEVLSITPVADPQITSISVPSGGLNDKGTITINGKNLFNYNTTTEPHGIFLELQDVSNGNYYFIELPDASKGEKEVVRPSADGESLSFIFDKSIFINGPVPAGDYRLRVTMYPSGVSNYSDSVNVAGNFTFSGKSLPSTITIPTSNGGTEIVPVITSGSKTIVTGGQKIAVPINDNIASRLGNISMGIENVNLTFLEIVQNYAIYGIPDYNPLTMSTIRNQILSLLVKDTSGNTIYSINDALKFAALAINLNPQYPDGSSILSRAPFIGNNVANEPNKIIKVKQGDVAVLSVDGLKTNDPVGVYINSSKDDNFPIYKRDGNVVYFQIPVDAQLGVIDVFFDSDTTTDRLIFHNAIEVIKGDPVTSQTNRFPSSITVNGVTTTLDYGFNFDFSEASGNTVFDKSGNNNNATLGGFKGTFPERFSLADGSTGLRFTNEAYLKVPDNDSYEMPNSFTFLSKIKINEINKYQTLLIKGSGVSGLLDSYTWSIDEQNRITLSMLKAGNTNPCTLFTQSVPLYLVTNPLNIQPNETIGLAVSFDQKNKVLKFYKNQTELSYTVAYPIPNSICGNVYDYNRLPDSPLDLYIGSYVYDNGTLHYPDSNLQELYLIANVKNRALNGSEVGKIFYDMGLRD